MDLPGTPIFAATEEEIGAVDSVATDSTLSSFLDTLCTVLGVATLTQEAREAFEEVDKSNPLQRDARLAAALVLLWGRPFLRSALNSDAASSDAAGTPEMKRDSEDETVTQPAPRPSTAVVTDRFGFLPPSDQPLERRETAAEKQARVFLETSRAEKWRSMLADWPRWSARHPGKIKSRVRKGIPASVRGAVWPLLAGVPDVRATVPAAPSTYYEEALQQATSETKPGGVIDRDLDRTFPRSTLFSEKGGEGQQALEFVLKAFAAYRPDVNYFQGMNFISAVLLTFMGREDTFYVLTALICNRPYSMGALFSRGRGSIRARNHQLKALMTAHLPRLARHLDAQGITTEFFCTEWFITLFSRSFHFEGVLRIWDVFLNEGWKIIFRVALLILKDNERRFLAGDLESIMLAFRVIGETTDPADLIQRALAVRITTAELQKYEDEWWQTAGPGAQHETR